MSDTLDQEKLSADAPAASVMRVSLVVALLILGAALWLWCAAGTKGSTSDRLVVAIRNSFSQRQYVVYLAVAIVAIIPATRRRLLALLDRLAQPEPRTKTILGIVISLAATGYLLLTAHLQHRDMFPKWLDEYMYLTQAQLLAHGRLWMDGHPLNEFFESFYLFVEPKYTTISWPGVPMMLVPAIWLSLPKWVVPLIISGFCVGLIYRIMTELIDGVAGLVAVFIVLGLRVFRFQSLMAMANVPMLFLALLMVFAWLKWRDKRKTRWAALIGIAMGWAAITRPADALAAAIPVGIALLFDLRGHSRKHVVSTLGIIGLCVVPFITLQLVNNYGVMGSITKLPYNYYCELYYPQFGMAPKVFDPTLKPQTIIVQKQLMYSEWLAPFLLNHQPHNWLATWIRSRVPETFITCVPLGALLMLVPVGLLGLTDRRRWVMFLVLPACLVIYGLLTVFISQYVCLAIGAVVLLILLGGEQIVRALPLKGATRVAVPGLIIAASIFGLPEVTPWIVDDRGHEMPIVEKNFSLAKQIPAPAIVMYKFTPGTPLEQGIHEEPVYNIDVAWPDDAPIIRVHDLGDERNRKLFAYYAEKSPDRVIYRIDRKDPTLTPIRLGTARELAGGK